jgi:hypothetical protein
MRVLYIYFHVNRKYAWVASDWIMLANVRALFYINSFLNVKIYLDMHFFLCVLGGICLVLWCLPPLSTISKFYWWRKRKYPDKNNVQSQVIA